MTNVKVLFLLLFVLSLKAFAYDPHEGNVTAIVGPFVSRTDYSGTSGKRPPWFGDVGLIVQGDLNTNGALEIAMFHMQKTYIRRSDIYYVSEKTELMHITLGYRRWLSPLWSASLALSSAYPMEQRRIIYNDLPANQTTLDTSASDTVDYGLDLSIQTELWNNDRFSVVSDIRYGLSVTEKQDENGSHYGILLGLKYLIQEKYPNLTKEKN